MKRFLTLGLLLVLGLATFAQFSNHSFAFGGQNRQYRQYVPGIYDGSTPVPLVIALHGLGDDMTNFSGIGLNYFADTANFIVVTPQALVDQLSGSTAWNSGASAFGFTLNGTVNDVGFINALIDSLSAQYNINPNRIYACGFSMGAFMCHRLACELNNRIAAIAAVAGTIGTALNCQPGRPVPVLHFHGTTDGTISYTANSFGLSTVQTLQYWATNNGCTQAPDTTPMPDLFNDGYTVDHIAWSGCDQNYGVEHFKVYGADHTWLGPANDIFYTREIWRFFNKYQHPNAATAAAAPITSHAMQLFPNPSQGDLQIRLQLDRNESLHWQLIDLQGKTTKQGSTQGRAGENTLRIDLGDQAAGLYLLRLNGKQWTTQQRVVVE
jgi:polyhydroxybutyrate depolymerase